MYDAGFQQVERESWKAPKRPPADAKYSTPPAKKTEPSNLVLRAQDHKKNPKFKGWQ